jgi:hypothetical protein
MSIERRAIILKLAGEAYELDLDVASGTVTQNENGQWVIGHHTLDEWLSSHRGDEVVLILGSLEDDRPVQTRTCNTCGRDYTDLACPHCRATRIRLRGRP